MSKTEKNVVEKFAQFAVELEFKDLPKETVQMAKNLVLDTVGCSIGGHNGECIRMVRRLVKSLGGKEECTIIGEEDKTSCTNAALANGSAARYLDFNDVYIPQTSSAHPSEPCIPSALAVGEREHRSGEEVITAIVAGYDIEMRITDAPKKEYIQELGYSVGKSELTAAVVAGKVLGLNEEQMVNAMSIAGLSIGVPGIQQSYFRGGTNMMKNISGGLACSRGIVSALLAKEGCEAGSRIFEGNKGFCDWVGGCDLDALYGGFGKKFRINETWIKPYPSNYSIHTSIEATINLVKKHRLVADEVREVNVRTFFRPTMLAMPQHYKPTTIEQAEFSVPFCLALAIRDGKVIPAQVTHDSIRDTKILALAAKIKVNLDPEMDKIKRTSTLRPAAVEIVTKDGKKYEERLDCPKGNYPQRPFPQDELEEKYRMLASTLFQEKQIKETISSINRLEKIKDISSLMELYAKKK